MEMKRREKEENDRAAAEAAKDLYDDFGENPGSANGLLGSDTSGGDGNSGGTATSG